MTRLGTLGALGCTSARYSATAVLNHAVLYRTSAPSAPSAALSATSATAAALLMLVQVVMVVVLLLLDTLTNSNWLAAALGGSRGTIATPMKQSVCTSTTRPTE